MGGNNELRVASPENVPIQLKGKGQNVTQYFDITRSLAIFEETFVGLPHPNFPAKPPCLTLYIGSLLLLFKIF